MTSRRVFLKGLLGAAPIGAAAENAASSSAAVERDYFQELGVETFINALAPYSSLGGNQMWPEVIEAMDYAMHRRARMKDLHDAVGNCIAHRLRSCDGLGGCDVGDNSWNGRLSDGPRRGTHKTPSGCYRYEERSDHAERPSLFL